MPTFSALLDQVERNPRSIELSEDWGQGRAIFGGLVSAIALRALRCALGDEAPLRSLLVQFAGPVVPGMCHLDARVTRSGRSASHGRVELTQGDERGVRCTVLASFGDERASQVAVEPPPRPEAIDPDRAQELPYIEGVTPVFTRHLAYRWALGAFPFTRATRAELGGYCRFRQPQRAHADELIVALADAWPPPILPVLARPAPASSMTWSLHLAAGVEPTADERGWWFFRSRSQQASGGYAQVEQTLWNPAGHAVAFGAQTAAVFDGPKPADR